MAAKILSATPLYVTEDDLGNKADLSQETRENLKNLNQKWLEINLGRTIAFKIEMNEKEAKVYQGKVDDLEKIFDGFIKTGKIKNHMEFPNKKLLEKGLAKNYLQTIKLTKL